MKEVALGSVIKPAGSRAGQDSKLPVYAVTKHSGFVPSLEYFKKQVFSRDTSNYKQVAKGDFAYATIHLDEGSIGVAPEDALISPMYTVFRPNETLVDSGYLLRLLKSPKSLSSYTHMGRGAVHRRKAISLATLKEMRIFLPPLGEQRRIAAILDQADHLRKTTEKQLEAVAALRDSIFNSFVHKNEYTLLPLSEAATVWDCPHTTPKWVNKGLICLRTSNLKKGHWDWSDTRYVDEGQFDSRSRGGGAQTGDIILSREGTVGIAAIIKEDMNVCMGQRLVQLRPQKDIVQPEFLLASLLFSLEPNRISQLMVGSTARHLNVRDLRALQLKIPSIKNQQKFSDSMKTLNLIYESLVKKISLAAELSSSLQARAFRGEL